MSIADSNPNPNDAVTATVTAVNKRYEALVAVRTKAVKGKGAWYWAHLEPILIRNSDATAAAEGAPPPPKAVKLKCNLCDAAFSASNPSRTASEHLRSGACPNFAAMLKPPISQLPPLSSPSSHHRKRASSSQPRFLNPPPAYPPATVTMAESSSSPFCNNQNKNPMLLSGGKQDLLPLAQFENSVKKLKTPKSPPCPSLTKERVEAAVDLLAEWFYESYGSMSFSSLEHPKLRAFLNLLGLPAVSKQDFSSSRLDSKYNAARIESEARLNDAAFFQVASDGWRCNNSPNPHQFLIKFAANLPNGTTVFQKAVYCDSGVVPSNYAENVLSETIQGICGNDPQRCVGIVADKYKTKALRNLELQNQWMINLSCQVRGFFDLIKDFHRELPLFRIVSESCMKVANLINSNPQVRNIVHKLRLQGFEVAEFIRVPPSNCDVATNFIPFGHMLTDLLNSSRILNLIVVDDSYKLLCLGDPATREVADIIQDVAFWNDVEAVRSLTKTIIEMAGDVEAERPVVAQCLPLWEDLRGRVKAWCEKYNFSMTGPVEKIVERRFDKVYHPAWSAAFVLDPLYLVRDASGKYLPPFTLLTREQEKDVDDLVTRLASREEAHIALMELMTWRSEGLDPLYAQAVQVKRRDPATGKMKAANPQSSRLVWETCLKDFKSLGKVAVRLLFLSATSRSVKNDWSFTRWFCAQGRSMSSLETAQKLFFVAAHAKLKSRDSCNDRDNDAGFLGAMIGGGGDDDDDNILNEVLGDASSI
ncbi:uncharacterized protein LOC127256052 [Andrographis paniculata]|uniref:uncharacterized protein LOC127256052 n=1 Tax=Andrographis paniculata TaxID=175694 RepID=UPI0021E9AADD|nr:uncharacterized protein LOC127256052 [Andrographis paniculata]